MYYIAKAEVCCSHEDSSTPSRFQYLVIMNPNISTLISYNCINTSVSGGLLKSVLLLGLLLAVPYADCARSPSWSHVINLLWELVVEAQT